MTSLQSVRRALARRAALGDTLIDAPGAADPMAGVTLRPLTVNRDPRGTLTELLRADWDAVFGEDMPFAQVYASVTVPGIARDEDRWHVHQRQTDRFAVLSGTIVVAIADARPGSPDKGRLLLVAMQAEDDAPAPFMVTVPPGTLHGLIAVGDRPAMLLNFPTRLWDASDEGRVAFADAAVTLPGGEPFAWDAVRQAFA